MQALRTTIRKYDLRAWADEQRRLFDAVDHGADAERAAGRTLSAA
jgi:hypothetical protein